MPSLPKLRVTIKVDGLRHTQPVLNRGERFSYVDARMSPYLNQWKSMGTSAIRCVVNIAIELAIFRVFVIIVHEITLKELTANFYCNLIVIAKKA